MQNSWGFAGEQREPAVLQEFSINWVYKYALIPTITILLQNVIL